MLTIKLIVIVLLLLASLLASEPAREATIEDAS